MGILKLIYPLHDEKLDTNHLCWGLFGLFYWWKIGKVAQRSSYYCNHFHILPSVCIYGNSQTDLSLTWWEIRQINSIEVCLGCFIGERLEKLHNDHLITVSRRQSLHLDTYEWQWRWKVKTVFFAFCLPLHIRWKFHALSCFKHMEAVMKSQ